MSTRRLVQECLGDDHECSLCGAAHWAAEYHAPKMQLFICTSCARQALPMLAVDALVGPHAGAAPRDCSRAIYDTRIDFDRRFWRATASLLAALLRRGAA
jgi:hypothetical protein